MKVLPFTIPVSHDKTIIINEEELPHFYIHLHRHQEIQLTWIMKGEGALVAGTNIHAFRSAEIYFIGANLPHVFKSDPVYLEPSHNEHVRALTLFFNPAAALSGLFCLPEMKQVNSFLAAHTNGFKVPAAAFSVVSAKMLVLLNAEGTDQLIHFVQLMHLLSGLTITTKLSVDAFAISDKEGIRLAAIYNYIIQHYNKPITLNDVAEEACMTPHAFCRYFKKHTRYTLITFINKVRINEACKMLMNGSADGIAAIAYNCGFNSITNFNKVFKAVTGKSPRSYLAQYAA